MPEGRKSILGTQHCPAFFSGFLSAAAAVFVVFLAVSSLSGVGAYAPAVYALMLLVAALAAGAAGRFGLPVLLVPDLAIAAWLVDIVVISRGMTLGQLFAFCAAASLLLLLLFLSGQGRKLVQAFPPCLLQAMPPALGLLLFLWGAEQGRLLLPSPSHLAMLGDFSDPLAYDTLLGLVTALGLRAMRVKLSLLWGIAAAVVFSFAEGFWVLPAAPFYAPEGWERSAGLFLLAGDGDAGIWAQAVFAFPWLVASLYFSSLGALRGLLPSLEGKPQGRKQSLAVMRLVGGTSLLAALLGLLPYTITPLSAAGEEEQRTSAAGWYAGGAVLCFMLCLPCYPLVRELASFPATFAVAAMAAGAVLLKQSRLSWGSFDVAERVSAALLLILVPLTYDVAVGAGIAVTAYTALKILEGKGGELSCLMRGLSIFFVLMFYLAPWVL